MCGVSNRLYIFDTADGVCPFFVWKKRRRRRKKEQHRVSFFFSANVTSSQSTAGTKLALIYGTFTSSSSSFSLLLLSLKKKKKKNELKTHFLPAISVDHALMKLIERARIIAIGTVPLHRRRTTPKFSRKKKQERGTHITNWLYYIGINLTQNGKRVEGGKKKKKKVIRHNGLFICVTIDNQRRNGQGLIGSPRLMPVRSAL